jgi:hypothetical protein
MIIGRDRASAKRSGDFDCNDDGGIILFEADGFELEFVLLDCLHNPAIDSIFAPQRFSLVTDNCFVRKAGEDGLHVVLIACLDIFLNDRRQFEVHDNLTVTKCLGDNPVAHPAVNQATNQISSVKLVREAQLNPAGFIKSL